MPATLGVLLSIPLNAQQPPLNSEPPASSSTSKPSPTLDGWHFTASPYLWFPGMHGTVGAFGHDVGVHASAGDLLSHFRFGLMGAATAQHKRLLLAGDLMWVRLGDSKALPFPNLGAVSADVKVSQVIWTSNVGIRLIDAKKFKADAVAGIRFWHLWQDLTFNPPVLGLNSSSSKSWADPVVGGHLQAPLGRKAEVNVAGDVGGWGVGSQLEYQIVGLLGYKLKPKWTLQAGYRYLFVDYRSSTFLYNIVESGALVGATINLK
jgi:hypothetical protein